MSGLPNSINHPDNTNTTTTAMEITNGFQIIFQVNSCTSSKLNPTMVRPNMPDTAIMARKVLMRMPFLDKKVSTNKSTHATKINSTGQKVNDLTLFWEVMTRLLSLFLKVTQNTLALICTWIHKNTLPKYPDDFFCKLQKTVWKSSCTKTHF